MQDTTCESDDKTHEQHYTEPAEDLTCRCGHPPQKDDKKYCRLAAVAKWTFEYSIAKEDLKVKLDKFVEKNKGVSYKARGEGFWSEEKQLGWESRCRSFHIIFDGLSDSAFAHLQPKAFVILVGEPFFDFDYATSWTRRVSCDERTREKELEDYFKKGDRTISINFGDPVLLSQQSSSYSQL
ncbi:hypothetical protein ACKAV7_014638 [Fusarium commune]